MVEFEEIQARIKKFIGTLLISLLTTTILILVLFCIFSFFARVQNQPPFYSKIHFMGEAPAKKSSPLRNHTFFNLIKPENKPTFSFSIEISRNNLHKADIKCEMLDNAKEGDNCTRFYWALINFEYQECAKRFRFTYSATSQTRLIVHGRVQMTPIKMVSSLTYKITSFKTWPKQGIPKMYNIYWFKKLLGFTVFSQPKKMSIGYANGECLQNNLYSTQDFKRTRDFHKKIFGLKNYNYSGIFTRNNVGFTGKEEKEGWFDEEWNMNARKMNVVIFHEARKLVCQCQKMNNDMKVIKNGKLVDATVGHILRKCFQDHRIKADFRPFLFPPSCYGKKIW